MNFFKHLLFVVQQRRAGNRVSLSAYIKGHDGIRLGRGCKIQADASVDATRSPGVRFGDKVEINRYAYVRGGYGGVRIAEPAAGRYRLFFDFSVDGQVRTAAFTVDIDADPTTTPTTAADHGHTDGEGH